MPAQHAPRGILPAAPATMPAADGQPTFGRFAGQVGRIAWADLAPPYARPRLWRRFHHKRWQYIALSTAELFCGIAIVDIGWTSTAFAYAFDRKLRREVGGYSQDGLPGLTASLAESPGAASAFRWFSNRIDFFPQADLGRVLRLRCSNFEVDAEINTANAAPSLFAAGVVKGGSVHTTQKSPGLRVDGEVRAGGRRYSLTGGVASLDYSNGLLARETEWRWASAHGHDVGFNLQAGYFGNCENVLWSNGEIFPLGEARFIYDDALNPMAPWRIHTADGLLDLVFQPEGLRRENKNLLVAASRYVQPIGTFSGWLKQTADARPRRIDGLAGVTENHYSRW